MSRVRRSFTQLCDEAREKGAIITSTEEEFIKAGGIQKSVVNWSCGGCGVEMNPKSVASILIYSKCRVCSRANNKTYDPTTTYEGFCEILTQKGWTMLSQKRDYKNTKTNVVVLCDKKHQTKTTQNRFVINKSGCKVCLNHDTTKYTADDAKKIFSNQGRELLSDVSGKIAANVKLQFKCNRCGSTGTCSIGNVNDQTSNACASCLHFDKRAEWDVITKKFSDAQCTLITTQEQYANNATKLLYVCSCGCPFGMTSWKVFSKGGRCISCCPKRREETCLLKYGKSNPSQSDEIKLRIKERWLDMYGVDHNMKVEDIRKKAIETNKKNNGGIHNLASEEIRIKAIIGHIKKYGVPPGFSEEIREKAKQTCINKYGQEYYIGSSKWKQYMIDNYDNEHYLQSEPGKAHMREKYGHECYLLSEPGKAHMREKYGHEYYLTSEPGKAHMKEKYGAEYFVMSTAYTEIMMKLYGVTTPLHNKDLFAKMMKSAFSVKGHKLPSGKIVKVQGYEGFAIDKLLSEGTDEEDFVASIEGGVPTINYTNIKSRPAVYYPDIYVKTEHALIEVKSTFTYFSQKQNNDLKLRACVESGYSAFLWVFNNKGVCIANIEYTKDGGLIYHSSPNETWIEEELKYEKIRKKQESLNAEDVQNDDSSL